MSESRNDLQDRRYLLLQMLGRGGMGRVIRAYDRLEQRLVALKFSVDAGPATPGHPLCREFASGLGLEHPNLVRTLELGHARSGPYSDGRPYLVLEHIHGLRLDRAFRPGKISPATLERVTARLLEVLDHLHRAGLLHRDVCPANVLTGVTRRGGFTVHLGDLGLAAPLGTMGSANRFSGSPAFAAPESFCCVELDGRVDLFALGLMMIYLGTGRHPVGGRNARETMMRLLAGAEVAIDAGCLPDRLRRFCLALTRRDRNLRPASAADAYRLLTSRELKPSRISRSRSAPAGREALRLALDRARLGARECLRVEASQAASLLDELRLWCREREIAHLEWDGDPVRLLMQLDGTRADRPQDDRDDLRRRYPLELVGPQLLPDPTHRPPRPALRAIASELLRRLRALAFDSTLVLAVRPAADGRSRALVREVVGQLEASPRDSGSGWLTVIQPTHAGATGRVGLSISA